LARTRPLQETLFGEMKERIKENDSSVQAPDGPFAYFTRYREGGQHPLICRSPRDGGAGEIMSSATCFAPIPRTPPTLTR
jgi:oligopeptidase B